MKLIAHRGFSLQYKDNSLIAIQEAIHREYDGVEIDVQLCQSGELMLCHDIYVDDHFVHELTYNELSKKGLYSLQEIYDRVPELHSTLLIVDIKGSDLSVCDALISFYRNKPIDNVYFCSFNRNIIRNLPTLFKTGSTFETTFLLEEFEMITTNLNAIILHWTCLDEALLTFCKRKNILVFTFTHKEDMELKHMLKYDVDGIITNGMRSRRPLDTVTKTRS